MRRHLPHFELNSEFKMIIRTAVLGVIALLGVAVLGRTLPAVPAPHPFVVTDHGAAGDSLKAAIVWTQPTDSATLGKADSTTYDVRVTKAAAFWGGKLIAANTDTPRRVTGTADSLKLLLPGVGDSVDIQVKNFRQWRKGDASIAGSAAARFKRTNAPPPNSPTLRVSSF